MVERGEERAITRMEINHIEATRRFVLELGGDEAYVEYEPVEGALDLVYTWVPPHQRRRGIGEAIVVRALRFARDQGLEVIPTCPFVPRVIAQNPEFGPLVRMGRP
jgi:predicted GNAT family acetyltransferase